MPDNILSPEELGAIRASLTAFPELAQAVHAHEGRGTPAWDDEFIDAARQEMVRRGISGAFVAADIRAILKDRAAGKTAAQAGAARAMFIIRRT